MRKLLGQQVSFLLFLNEQPLCAVLYSLLPSYFFFQVGLKEVEDILRDVDLNGDGLVDFEGKTDFSNNRFKVKCSVRLGRSCSVTLLLLFSQSLCGWCLAKIVKMIRPECEATSFSVPDQQHQKDFWAIQIWLTLEIKLLECYGVRSRLTLWVNKCSSWKVSSSTEAEFAVA